MKIAPLSWAAFALMGITLLASAFVKVDFHSVPSILAAAATAAAALASLCMHPPWASSAPVVTQAVVAPAAIVMPAAPAHSEQEPR